MRIHVYKPIIQLHSHGNQSALIHLVSTLAVCVLQTLKIFFTCHWAFSLYSLLSVCLQRYIEHVLTLLTNVVRFALTDKCAHMCGVYKVKLRAKRAGVHVYTTLHLPLSMLHQHVLGSTMHTHMVWATNAFLHVTVHVHVFTFANVLLPHTFQHV